MIFEESKKQTEEKWNKLIILITGLAICAIIYIVTIDNRTSESIVENVTKITENKNVITPTPPPHPYNECIKLLIDQVNKENKESDFNKMKTVCSGLLEKEKN